MIRKKKKKHHPGQDSDHEPGTGGTETEETVLKVRALLHLIELRELRVSSRGGRRATRSVPLECSEWISSSAVGFCM